MSMITARAGRAVAGLLAVALAGPAAASAGNGIRLGGSEGRLHPYLEVEDRYDSNVYYTQSNESVGDMILHIRPGFELKVPGEVASAEMSGALDWAQYLGMGESETSSKLSKLYAQAALGLSVNRRGALGLELDDEFRRAQGTTALVLTNAVVSNANALRVRVPWRPGGGALVFSLTGAWLLETFEAYFDQPVCTDPICAVDVGDLGYNEFRAGADVRWRFLPRTSGVFQGGWFSRMPNASGADDVSGVEAQAGVTGLVTPHLGATIKAGYATTTGLAQGDVGTWLASVEAEWIATDSASVRLGWGHALGIDPGPALYRANRVFGGGRLLLAGRFALRLDVNWETRDYETFGAGSSSATVLRVEPAVEAGIARWMSASLGFAYSDRSSDFVAVTTPIQGFDYSKTETWLRVAVRY
jgi:hypothetical protein